MALEHITVLDLTHMLSGPYGTMLLADLGARTIKVEPPGTGEGTRRLLENDPDYARDGMGAYYLTLNRNKESVCVDLKSEAGKDVFLDLVRHADVVFDNFSVGVTARLGIDYESLSQVNPRIVTCSVTGFGQSGPETHRPAFDQVVQAMGGGMFGVMGVLAALAERERTGRGQHVDISMLDAQISLLNYMATMHLMSGHVPAGIGNGHFVHVPYNSYPTADGHIIIACIGDAFFERFVEFIDLPALRKPEYLQQPVRYAAKAEIDAIVGAELQKQPTAYWLERLRAARIPCGPVNNFEQALNDVQVRARDMVVEVPLKTGEMLRMPGNPIKLSAASPKTYTCPPSLGEHTRSVLTQLAGYSPEQLEQLRRDGAIA